MLHEVGVAHCLIMVDTSILDHSTRLGSLCMSGLVLHFADAIFSFMNNLIFAK